MGRQAVGVNRIASAALGVLGNQVRLARQARGWTMTNLAAAAGVSERTVRSIEQGAASTSIGNVFNVASVAGVQLFGVDDPSELLRLRREGDERIALLPARVDRPRKAVDDGGLDF